MNTTVVNYLWLQETLLFPDSQGLTEINGEN